MRILRPNHGSRGGSCRIGASLGMGRRGTGRALQLRPVHDAGRGLESPPIQPIGEDAGGIGRGSARSGLAYMDCDGRCCTLGLHRGLTQGLLSAMVARAAPAALRGSAFGIFNLISGLMLLAASTIGELLRYALMIPRC